MIGNNWDEVLKEEYEKEYFKNLMQFVEKEYNEQTIYPKKDNIYSALKLTLPECVKVVILGQDPYINEGEAHGLAFSVCNRMKTPPSLRNILKELESDLEVKREDTDLTSWAVQDVLLLNTTLTVRAGSSNSHFGKGWGIFTDAIIKWIGDNKENIVFILWGKNAQSKEYLINKDKGHLILKSPHPSPLSASRGFFGCKHFSKTNEFLKEKGIDEIKWEI